MWTKNRLFGIVKLQIPGSLSSCRDADYTAMWNLPQWISKHWRVSRYRCGLSLYFFAYAILSLHTLSAARACAGTAVLALTYIFLTSYELNRRPPI